MPNYESDNFILMLWTLQLLFYIFFIPFIIAVFVWMSLASLNCLHFYSLQQVAQITIFARQQVCACCICCVFFKSVANIRFNIHYKQSLSFDLCYMFSVAYFVCAYFVCVTAVMRVRCMHCQRLLTKGGKLTPWPRNGINLCRQQVGNKLMLTANQYTTFVDNKSAS